MKRNPPVLIAIFALALSACSDREQFRKLEAEIEAQKRSHESAWKETNDQRIAAVFALEKSKDFNFRLDREIVEMLKRIDSEIAAEQARIEHGEKKIIETELRIQETQSALKRLKEEEGKEAPSKPIQFIDGHSLGFFRGPEIIEGANTTISNCENRIRMLKDISGMLEPIHSNPRGDP